MLCAYWRGLCNCIRGLTRFNAPRIYKLQARRFAVMSWNYYFDWNHATFYWLSRFIENKKTFSMCVCLITRHLITPEHAETTLIIFLANIILLVSNVCMQECKKGRKDTLYLYRFYNIFRLWTCLWPSFKGSIVLVTIAMFLVVSITTASSNFVLSFSQKRR